MLSATQLLKSDWQRQATEHRSYVERWTVPFRTRRAQGASHPIHDFLFVYYRYSPAKLEKWHPGVDYTLMDANQVSDFQGSEYTFSADGKNCFLDPQNMEPQVVKRFAWIADLLRQTENRRPNFSCLGLHEWAMVYQARDIRHKNSTPLRLPQQEIDQIVESRPLTCTHFDAFRFFAPTAKPLNREQLTLEGRQGQEQPACIHANMDLYKWAFKSMPWIGSDLLIRCFDLAMTARVLDMRASPYDLSGYGNYLPIKIETAQGRTEYEQEQRQIANQAVLLRAELANKIETISNRALELNNR